MPAAVLASALVDNLPMLDWLGNLAQKTDHPMHSVEEAERLLTGLADEPLKALEEIASWLTTLVQAAGFQPATRLAVIKLIDEAGQPFEPELARRFITDRALSAFERQQLWDVGLQFWQRLEHAYTLCLDEMKHDGKALPARNPDCALLLVRRMRAVAQQIRWRNLRYLHISEAEWRALYELYSSAETAGYETQRVTAYADGLRATTVRDELTRALLLAAARPDSMLPCEMDIAARIAVRYADACVFDRKPRTGLIWAIDLALPRAPELASGAATLQATARFFGTSAATAKVREVIRGLVADPNLKEQRFGEEHSKADKLAVLERVADYWGERPPRRREKRTASSARLEVVRGFAHASRKIPRVSYRGWSELIAGLDLKLLARLNIIADPLLPVAPVPTETWAQSDSSAWGLSAEVARGAEHEAGIGTLCTFKIAEGPWWLAVVRRLMRESEDALHAGMEVLARKPAMVLLRRVGHGGMSVQNWSKTSDASGSDYMNALLLGESREEKRRHEIVIAKGEFLAGLVYEAMLGDTAQHFQFEELIEQGADFDRVRFTRVKRIGAVTPSA